MREREEEEEGRGEMGRCGARRWKEREGVVASGKGGERRVGAGRGWGRRGREKEGKKERERERDR